MIFTSREQCAPHDEYRCPAWRFGLAAAAGVELDDPHGVLYGTSDGKHVRFVTAADIDAPRIERWLRAIVASRNA